MRLRSSQKGLEWSPWPEPRPCLLGVQLQPAWSPAALGTLGEMMLMTQRQMGKGRGQPLCAKQDTAPGKPIQGSVLLPLSP